MRRYEIRKTFDKRKIRQYFGPDQHNSTSTDYVNIDSPVLDLTERDSLPRENPSYKVSSEIKNELLISER